MSIELTPTPWNVDGGYGTCVERDAEGERIHIADCIDREHAAHIMRCVNARDDLAKALRTCADRFERCLTLNGTGAEYAAAAVAEYRALIAKVAP